MVRYLIEFLSYYVTISIKLIITEVFENLPSLNSLKFFQINFLLKISLLNTFNLILFLFYGNLERLKLYLCLSIQFISLSQLLNIIFGKF